MTIIHSLLLSSGLILTGGPETTDSAIVRFDEAGIPTAAAEYDDLRSALGEMVDYPVFAHRPDQEIIVTVRFRIDDENRIDLIDVRGSDRTMNRYVADHLDGSFAGERPALRDLTFQTTLRFVVRS